MKKNYTRLEVGRYLERLLKTRNGRVTDLYVLKELYDAFEFIWGPNRINTHVSKKLKGDVMRDELIDELDRGLRIHRKLKIPLFYGNQIGRYNNKRYKLSVLWGIQLSHKWPVVWNNGKITYRYADMRLLEIMENIVLYDDSDERLLIDRMIEDSDKDAETAKDGKVTIGFTKIRVGYHR